MKSTNKIQRQETNLIRVRLARDAIVSVDKVAIIGHFSVFDLSFRE